MKVLIPGSKTARLRAWAMVVTRIDRSVDGPATFQGTWLPRGEHAALEPGMVVLLHDERGSIRKPRARVLRVKPDGSLRLVVEDKSIDWPRVLRDEVAALLPPGDPIRDAHDKIVAILDGVPPANAAVIVHQLKDRYGEAIP